MVRLNGRSRAALAHITGDDVDTSQGFIIYAAMAATTQDSPLKRLWHESEVPLPKRFKQAMKSPQQKEWWNGME